MKVSFGGIKNISTSFDYIKDPKKKNNTATYINMSFELNNIGENDLDTFKKLLTPKVLKNDGVVNLSTFSYKTKNGKEQHTEIYANGYKLEPAIKENFSPILKMCKLAERISQMKDYEFVHDYDYVNSKDFKKTDTYAHTQYSHTNETDENQKKAVEKSLSPAYNKFCATLMQSNLIKALGEITDNLRAEEEYFED